MEYRQRSAPISLTQNLSAAVLKLPDVVMEMLWAK